MNILNLIEHKHNDTKQLKPNSFHPARWPLSALTQDLHSIRIDAGAIQVLGTVTIHFYTNSLIPLMADPTAVHRHLTWYGIPIVRYCKVKRKKIQLKKCAWPMG